MKTRKKKASKKFRYRSIFGLQLLFYIKVKIVQIIVLICCDVADCWGHEDLQPRGAATRPHPTHEEVSASLLLRIRIQARLLGSEFGSCILEGQSDPLKMEKLRVFLFKCRRCYFWRAEGFSLIFKAVLWIRIDFNADPDLAFYLNADPDPGRQISADPDSDPGQTFNHEKQNLHEKYT